jgi:type IV pilus assembly protein PilB
VNDEMIQDLIMKKKSAHEITRKAIDAGNLKTLKYDAGNKVLRGITTLEEAGSAVMM